MNSNQYQFQKSQSSEVLRWKYGLIQIMQQLPLFQRWISQDNHFIIHIPEIRNICQIPISQKCIEIDCSNNEQLKQWETVDHLCKLMLQKKVNRQSTIYIIGGGMLLDLAGLACSLYMRGVKKVIYVPTTLLSIVDATVGGKNGFNWNRTKNMLGVTRHPHEIKVYFPFLYSLSERQFNNGMAQIIKKASTHDKDLFCMLEQTTIKPSKSNNIDMLVQIIKKCLQIKVRVVEEDQYDRSSRKWLNFGHTIGHALQLSRLSQSLKHGQSVSVGMVKQLEIGYKLGLIKDRKIIDRLIELLLKFKLPTQFPQNIDTNFVIEQMKKDKKNSKDDTIQLTLINEIGQRKRSTSKIALQDIKKTLISSVSIQNSCLDVDKARLSIQKWNQRFPSSKSLSIRYLYISSLYYLLTQKQITLTNFLNSDDTECLKKSLTNIGFILQQNRQQKTIQIRGYQKKYEGQVYVGNSGLTARFILPLCSYLQGCWQVNCHQRMSQRPNKQIIQYCLNNHQCQISYKQKQFCFPLIIKSSGKVRKGQNQKIRKLKIDSIKSSQFISSILINSCLNPQLQLLIQTEGGVLVSQSYIQMTFQCLKKFGASCLIQRLNQDNYISINNFNNHSLHKINFKNINIEKDLSSLTYPYAFSLLFDLPLPNLPLETSQGDIKFYEYCQKLLKQNQKDNNDLIQFDFNQCTDSFMTMAILIATGKFNIQKPIQIKRITNQRIKQSNRIELTKRNLQKIGYFIEQKPDGLLLPPRKKDDSINFSPQKVDVVFETADDHRLAMSMAILSCYLSLINPNYSFTIDNKDAVNKTFPQFWDYLSDCGICLSYNYSDRDIKSISRFTYPLKNQKMIVTGNRGSGKTTLSQKYAQMRDDTIQIDLDDKITKYIKDNLNIDNIGQYISRYGWQKFRQIETDQLQKIMTQNCHNQKNVIICTGGGIIQSQESRYYLQQYSRNIPVIYLERQFDELRISYNDRRPPLDNFRQRSIKRQQKYEQVANFIINIPSTNIERETQLFASEIKRLLNHKKLSDIEGGNILCLGKLHDINQEQAGILQITQQQSANIVGIEIRVDLMLDNQIQSKQLMYKSLRKIISEFKLKNINSIHNIPTILTLRSKDQYGQFHGNYCSQLKNMSKIPTDYLDVQIQKQLNQNYLSDKFYYHPNKLLLSYHGNRITQINNLCRNRWSNKKLCYYPTYKSDESSLIKEWLKFTDICYNLADPFSRIDNKFKMTILDRDKTGLISIPNQTQLKLLHKIIKTSLKFRK